MVLAEDIGGLRTNKWKMYKFIYAVRIIYDKYVNTELAIVAEDICQAAQVKLIVPVNLKENSRSKNSPAVFFVHFHKCTSYFNFPVSNNC